MSVTCLLPPNEIQINEEINRITHLQLYLNRNLSKYCYLSPIRFEVNETLGKQSATWSKTNKQKKNNTTLHSRSKTAMPTVPSLKNTVTFIFAST